MMVSKRTLNQKFQTCLWKFLKPRQGVFQHASGISLEGSPRK